MANNLYSAYKAGAKAEAEEGKSLVQLGSYDWQSKMIDTKAAAESEKVGEVVGTIGDTLSLMQTAHGAYSSAMEDTSALEAKHGELESPEGFLGKAWQKAQLSLGIGEHKFGDTTIKGSDLATRGAQAKMTMWDEANQKVLKETEAPSEGDKDFIGPEKPPVKKVENQQKQEKIDLTSDKNPYRKTTKEASDSNKQSLLDVDELDINQLFEDAEWSDIQDTTNYIDDSQKNYIQTTGTGKRG
tara:strand:- start:2873 stop:3598 length:726 start_codon:yes stop_codon:yes gene_type:complete